MRSGEAAEPVLLCRKPGWAVIFRASACFSKTTGHSAVECVPSRPSQPSNPCPSRTPLHSANCLPGALRERPGTERSAPFRAARTRRFFDRYFSRNTHSVRNRPPPQTVTAASRSMQSVSKRPPYRSSLLSAVSSSCLCQRLIAGGELCLPTRASPGNCMACDIRRCGRLVDASASATGTFLSADQHRRIASSPGAAALPRPYATLVSPASTLR